MKWTVVTLFHYKLENTMWDDGLYILLSKIPLTSLEITTGFP